MCNMVQLFNIIMNYYTLFCWSGDHMSQYAYIIAAAATRCSQGHCLERRFNSNFSILRYTSIIK